MKLTLIAVGKARGAFGELCAEYVKRLSGELVVREIVAANARAETAAILAAIPQRARVVVLDERGHDLTSRELADKITSWQDQSVSEVAFIIGGADGLSDEVKARGDFVLGLGRKTWPHKLARVMLIEQLYRAQKINSGHPYHRD